ncbi:MAG: [acyl-carrier-protein] S-malonyltransferase [Betaproteobacteria bacterium]|jgi:[acyl-carrier-protein] S-malonyltransferase|nr:[acyl-carrier-protein] S-malonyltransferase [Betaproteobacteria bacterium]
MNTLAFIFPGQGSQTVGMLQGFSENAAVGATIAEASEALGQDLGQLIAQGPAEALSLTVNTQPVMLAASMAFYRAWLAAGGPQPGWAAGHSLGEYSALTAAGVFSLADATRLVRFRAQEMQSAVPVGVGGMAAVLGMESQAVIAACADAAQGQIVEAVNFNAPDQTVIAGHQEAVDRACALVKERGAKRALPLAVSAPFHSSLLAPAAEALRERLAQTAVNTPLIQVVNNVDVAIERDADRIRDALSRQAMRPVRWVEVIEKLSANGVTTMIECGPGKVLTGLVKRIAPQVTTLAINDQSSLQAALSAASG